MTGTRGGDRGPELDTSVAGSGIARSAASLVVIAGGLAAVSSLFGVLGWTWLLWIVVGFLGGIVAGNGHGAWPALSGVAVWLVSARVFDLPHDEGPFWWLGAAVTAVALVIAAVMGSLLALQRSPFAAARSRWSGVGSRARIALVAVLLIALVGLTGYTAYIAQAGASEFVHPAVAASDCRTPDLVGWTYEAINYDQADDARLAAANPDRTACATQGEPAGPAIVTADGIQLAGWYVPAGNGAGPAAPTLVVVHGFRSNKSDGLKYAAPFHDTYNLVIPDLRNSGRSTGDSTTMGLRESYDVLAMVDWLDRTKHPTWIGLVGNSMGGATALAEAVDDDRIAALILDSMHAEIVTSVGNVLETEHGQPALPGSWAIVTAVSQMVGGDVTTVDPIRTIRRLGDRPVLLIQGTNDLVDPPAEASDLNFHAALDAGVHVELQYCLGAGHGRVIDTCPDLWASWALGFLEEARDR